MALSKKQKSYLLVAILAGGTIIGEGIGLYNLNNNIKDLHNQKTKLEKNIESLNEDLNKQLENVENLTKEKEDLNKDGVITYEESGRYLLELILENK